MRYLFEEDPLEGIRMLQQDFPDIYRMISKEIIGDRVDSLLAQTTLMLGGAKIPTGRKAAITVKEAAREKSSKPGMNLARAMMNL